MSFFKAFIIAIILLSWTGSALAKTPKESKLSTLEEDRYILLAFEALDRGNPKGAIDIFETLYKKSGKLEYLKEVMALHIARGEGERAEASARRYLAENPDDFEVRRALVGILASLQRFPEAKAEARALLEREKSEENHELLASLYFVKQEYAAAEKELEKAYALEQNEMILDRLTSTQMLFLKNPDKAITLLETHARLKGCSALVCEKLAEVYRQRREGANLERIYQKLYEELGDERYGRGLLEAILYRKDYARAIEFLEKSDLEPEILLDLYRHEGRFIKAQAQAEHLYRVRGEVGFLGLGAMLEYENATDKNDPALLASVSEKLTILLKERREHLYLNFLGYLLIDHSLDIHGGIALVKEALEQLPTSPHYRDSLAWGYYRLGECERALAEMEKIPLSEIEAEEEMKLHYKLMRDCAKK